MAAVGLLRTACYGPRVIRLGQRIRAAFAAVGLVTLSVFVFASVPPSAAATVEEVQDHEVSDAGADVFTQGDASSGVGPEAGPGDGGAITAPSDEAGDDRDVRPRLTRVVVESVVFANGEVPRAQASLDKLATQELAACATERGGVSGEGTVELKFLVRVRGRAEGVSVGRVRNVPPRVVDCLAWTLSRRPVGAPSDDPVGVTALLRLIDLGPANPKPARKTEKGKPARSR